MRNPLGPSWMPKLGGAVLAAATLASVNSKKEIVREWASYVVAGGAILLGSARQNGVTSERAGLKAGEKDAAGA